MSKQSVRRLWSLFSWGILTAGFLNLLPQFVRAAGAAEFRKVEETDIAIYGATPGGIAAAISAAGHGHEVTLIEPTNRIGGLLTCGLSHTDFRSFEALGGTFLEFSQRVERYYQDNYGRDSEQARCWRGTHGEPRVNLLILAEMLQEHRQIQVILEHQLTAVETGDYDAGRRPLKSLTLRGRAPDRDRTIQARLFVDASYEGDLLAMAGEPFHVGRESRQQYGESLAGNEQGQADSQVQGENFRLVMTDRPDNRIYPHPPAGYHREDFVDVLPLFAERKLNSVFINSDERRWDAIYKLAVPLLPNRKADVNDVSLGVIRLSMPDINDAYPTADAATRGRIIQEHVNYNVGLLHFLQNDEAVPSKIQEEARQWGLCRDEFEATDHIPPQLYIREARRMVGQYIYTERDTDSPPGEVRARLHPDSIAISDYILNCHGTGRTGTRFNGQHQGEFYKFVQPSQIPYGVIVPAKATNLLVPVAVSSSHVGFSMLRYEPVWMSLGQAAGHAAHLSLTHNLPVQDVSVAALQDLIHADNGITIYVADVSPGSENFAAVQWLGNHGFFHGLHDPQGKPMPRPKSLGGQYNEAFPLHAVEMRMPLDEPTQAHWRARAETLGIFMNPPVDYVGQDRGAMLWEIYRNRRQIGQ